MMKIRVLVKDKDNNIIYYEDFFMKQRSQINEVSSKVSDKIIELESKYPYPDYEIDQNVSFENQNNKSDL
ncbi:MAG: hypothetical protein QXY79_04905 [Candidatus Methanomethylicia archaeon]